MALNPGEVYSVMECAYRNGALDKLMAIQGDAVEAVMDEGGLNMGDLLNRLDDAQEGTVKKAGHLLDRVGFLLKYADNDRLMKIFSRLIDIPVVRRKMVTIMKYSITKTITGESPPSIGERIKAALGRAA